MTDEEKACAAAIAKTLNELPESMQQLVLIYAQGIVDAKTKEALDNERDRREQE